MVGIVTDTCEIAPGSFEQGSLEYNQLHARFGAQIRKTFLAEKVQMPGQIEQRPILLKPLSLFDPKEGRYLDKNISAWP